MTVAKACGLPVPDFYLSDNGRLFVLARFDRDDSGNWLGFEDACVLQGLLPEDKYSGSYEKLAKTMRAYLSPEYRVRDLRWLFLSVAVSWAVRNGDAHLKNFGLLYESPFAHRWLAPVYDIVSTTPYLSGDVPALTLQGRKVWWPVDYLVQFGRLSCGLSALQVYKDLELLASKLELVAQDIEHYCKANPEFCEVGGVMVNTYQASAQEIMKSL